MMDRGTVRGRGGWPATAVALAILFAATAGPAALAQSASAGGDAHIGVASCAGSTCHGATAPWDNSTVLQTEYVIWSQKDLHAKSYTVLLNDASKRIAANLGLPNAHEASVCLDCHADNVPAAQRGRFFQISDGVGCESCHGGAQRWLGQHIAPAAYSRADNIAAGMYPTEDPVKRAELCLSCHFGDDQRLVTHRIMGAGHPRMSFELDTFTAIQPAHFVVDKDYAQRKALANGMQTWAIGQAVALARRLDVLLDPKRGRMGLFPELVLFDCQACHQPITSPNWQRRPSTGLGPGRVRFDDSNLLMLRVIAGQIDAGKGRALAEQTTALHKASTVSADAFYAAARTLKATTQDLVALFAGRSFTKADVAGLANRLLAEARAAEFSDYAGAEQALMGLSAVLNAAERLGMGDAVASAKGPVDRAYAALGTYDGWDYPAFKAAMAEIAPIR
jgi:hypothetical protein